MNSLFARSRNRDFLNACRRRIADLTAEGHQPTTIQQIYAVGDHILTKPAPAYYVDYYRACHILSRLSPPDTPPKPHTKADKCGWICTATCAKQSNCIRRAPRAI